MKKIILLLSIMIISFSGAIAFANTPDTKSGSDNGPVPVKNEIRLSGENFNRLTKPDREIRKMDNDGATAQEGRRRGRGQVVIGERHRSNGVVYIGGGTLLLIILIILLV